MKSSFLRAVMRLAIPVLLFAFVCPVAKAQFVVHSVKGKITILRNGTEQTAGNGTNCERNDIFRLGEGASISLLNKITNKVYSADGPGEMSISQIVTRAMDRSKSHASNVVSAMNISKPGKPTTVYEQNGMVRRSQAVLDPEAYSVNVEPEALAIAILNSPFASSTPENAPLEVCAATESGLSFKAKSTGESPIYFNIIKFRTSEGKILSADISELGQPINAYVLQPQQELMREQPEESNPGEIHLLVATPFGYDIDSLLDIIEEMIENEVEIPAADPELIAYIFKLN